MNKASNSNRDRRGFSLIEMMVVIALSALLLGVATSMLFSLRQWDRRTREGAVRSEQLFRLSETLRDDIRQGSDVLLSVDGPLVVMTPAGEQIRYGLTPDGCTRSIGVPSDTKSPNDLFAIGPAVGWHVDRLANGRRPLVAVTLEVPADDPKTRTAPLLVYSALGADVRPAATSE